jgi:hypothetical protein
MGNEPGNSQVFQMKKEESDEKWKKVILIIFIVQGITPNVYR